MCRGNAVAELTEIRKLVCLPFLRALILSGKWKMSVKMLKRLNSHAIPSTECQVTEVDDYRLEVLIALRKLERLDKDEFTEDERTDAEEVY